MLRDHNDAILIVNKDTVKNRLLSCETVINFADELNYFIQNYLDRTFIGTAGDDILIGGEFFNTFEGIKGNDVLTGGKGNDTYVFNKGDGQDTIVDNGDLNGSDILAFGEGLIMDDDSRKIDQMIQIVPSAW